MSADHAQVLTRQVKLTGIGKGFILLAFELTALECYNKQLWK
jgi:hypothetical protein